MLPRLTAAARALPVERRLAALAALALLASMLLPWYEKSVVVGGRFTNDAVSAFGAFSFVELAVFLVAATVLALLFARADGRRFELPGGDGGVVLGAGVWAGLLIFWRVFDRPEVEGPGGTVGIEWGFLVAFAAAGALALAGWRIRALTPPAPPVAHDELPPDEAPTVRQR